MTTYIGSYRLSLFYHFFFNDTATTEIYTLSLHDALPIYNFGRKWLRERVVQGVKRASGRRGEEKEREREYLRNVPSKSSCRSEEHTSELQSLAYLVCRLLLEKKKK